MVIESFRILEVEVQCYSGSIPVRRRTRSAMLSPVIGINHGKMPYRPLDSRRIPFLVPRVLRPVVEDLGRAVRSETELVNKQITFDG